MRELDELPDAGDPFDVVEARRLVSVPDEQNADVAYAAAHRDLARLPASLSKVDFKANTVEIGASHSLLSPWVYRPTRHQGGCDSHATRTMSTAG
jgi:hypothetical protein